MEENLLKKNAFTAEYRFAKDLVSAVIEMRFIYVPSLCNLQLDNVGFTAAEGSKVKDLFSKEWPKLDEHVRKFTCKNGRSNYGDHVFLLCIVHFIEQYKPELKSKDEFLLVCSRISYVTACFLRNNDQSNAISIAVDRVYEIILDTFYDTMINGNKPIIKDVRDLKYRFAYDLVKTLVERRGISVPDLELPNSDNCLFTSQHKNEVKEFLSKEFDALDALLKSFTCREGKFDYSDENLSRCFDKIVEDFGFEQKSEEEFVLVCARIAFAAAWFLRENSQSNAKDLASNLIHQMVKKTDHFNKYDQDDEYRFSCDLVTAMIEMRINPFPGVEISHCCSSLFMITHRNKMEDFLSSESHNLDEVMRKFTSKDESFDYGDNQFLSCVEQITDNYKPPYKSKEEIVLACAKIAYVAACFTRKNNKSKASELALDRMLIIVKDISNFPSSEYEKVLIMRTRDDHYRFAYDLVKTVLEMKNVPVSDVDLPDPDNFLFTDLHRNTIENLFAKESSELDKVVDKLTNRCGVLDYSDGNFLRSMNEIIGKYQYNQKTEESLVYIATVIAHLSACFSKDNWESNASFLAVNRIYEMIKDLNCFSDSTEEKVLIVKSQDDHYRFAHDVAKAVFEFKGVPVSSIDLPDSSNILFMDTHRNKIQDYLSKVWFQIDEMVEKLTNNGNGDYSDNKFIHCMNQILQDSQSDQKTEEEFVSACVRIAYTAAEFLIKNCRSNASFLAVNRMYEMSKDSFCDNIHEDDVKKENYQFAYDLITAILRIISNSSFKIGVPDSGDSLFTIKHRNDVQDFLSREWPRLHQLVRRFTKTCAGLAFNDGHFLHCMQQIINDYGPDQKSEEELLFLNARIVYMATFFLRKNQNSNAAALALDRIYQMRIAFCRLRNATEVKSSVVDVPADNYRLAFDIVKEVMELQGTSVPGPELPAPNIFLFTSNYKRIVKKLITGNCSKIVKLVEKLTKRDGKLDYSDGTFQRCMNQIFKDYKYEQAQNEEGFVRLCARMAYPVSCFLRGNNESNARTLAILRIHEMVNSIYYFNKDQKDKKFMDDVADDKYRFAYDLVKTVVEMYGIKQLNIKLPNSQTSLFTVEHKLKMEEFFSNGMAQLIDLMKKFTCKEGNVDYSDKNFGDCMDHIMKEYKPECYTEEGFVLLCGRIAFISVCYLNKMSESNATLLAVNRIHEMVKDVFSRGTLRQSSW